MQLKLLKILACPYCLGELVCTSKELYTGGELMSGILKCLHCDRTYLIKSGIPRFLPSDNYTSSFGYQWNHFSSVQIDSANGTKLSERRFYSETGWTRNWMSGKWFLDAGCGAGRFLDVASQTGCELVGVDMSDAIDVARTNLGQRKNIHFVQASIDALPFRENVFDGCYCIGVLQHTPDPLKALSFLPKVLKEGGKIAVTLYERRRWTPLSSKYLLRSFTKRLNKKFLLSLIKMVMPVLFPVTDVLFRIPYFGRFFMFMIPIANYVHEPALSREQRYEWAILDTFDMLSPEYDQPQKYRDTEKVLSLEGIIDIKRSNNPGLNLVGRKSATEFEAKKYIKVAHVTTVSMSLRYLLLNQLQSIQEAGYEVIGISAPGPDVQVIEEAGIRHIAVPMTRRFTPFADIISLWKLYRIMQRERFTIVHVHTPKAGFIAQIAARMAKVPIIVSTVHGYYFHNSKPKIMRYFYKLLERISAQYADFIFSQNHEDLRLAPLHKICSPDKMSYLGNGIDMKRFDRNLLSKEDIIKKRLEFGFSEQTQVVGFVGRLVREKGLVEFMEAAQLILKMIPTARFLIVGPIDDEKGDALTPNIADRYNVGNACVFTGLRQDMPELYAVMNVLVLPSHREGLPRVLMEASAMGVPCIATDIRGCREAIQRGHNGLLVPVGNVPVLAETTIGLLSDVIRLRRMADEGQRIAKELFNERIVIEKILSKYSRLLERKKHSIYPLANHIQLRTVDVCSSNGISFDR